MAGRRDLLVVYLKGLCMGTADAVPGVSGGTIALIVGIYERLLAAVTAVNPRRIRRFLFGLRPGRFGEARAAFGEMDGYFVLALGAGIVTAFVTVLRVVAVLLERYPVETFAFFFGLIAASALVLYAEVRLDTPVRIVAALAGFLLAFLVSGYAAGALGSSLPVVFLAGAVAVSAMILPGISGSLLLVILGQYEFMSRSISAFTDALAGAATGNGAASVVETGVPVATFLAGAMVGAFTIAHLVKRALETHREATLAFLVSLILGALRAPVIEVSKEVGAGWGSWSSEIYVSFAAFAVAGALLVVGLDYFVADVDVSAEGAERV